MPPLLQCVLILVVMCGGGSAARAAGSLKQSLIRVAPGADPNVIGLAVDAVSCAAQMGLPSASRLAVIDYSRPSVEPRLWVFDLEHRRLLHSEWVAHGRNSGENFARSFSNEPGSYESSLGLFLTRESYDGHNGYSLRMDGLDSGFNDLAAERAIVMHGAPYVNTGFFRTQGRLGRSQGCPAVRPEVARSIIDSIKGGQYVFSYYPDPIWLASSSYLHCGSQRMVASKRADATADATADAGALAAGSSGAR